MRRPEHQTALLCSLHLDPCIMQNTSFLQARCEEPIMTTDWGLPLLLALLLLALLYAFLYLPATAQRALLEQALRSNNTTAAVPTASEDD
ncbi:unnamed protein product [Pleuronectes platessa]|uniref:Uncharacterized protein n=1 Tax=Pleuronectes platessa TaxID=8262 RepID=A0A9N7Z2S2_PLEPL|nr:unnamed protein product [Pleuronectes platessa]